MKIKKRVLSKVQNGSIVLFHNNGLHTSEALRDIIVSLKNQGYTFRTIYDLIYKENYQIESILENENSKKVPIIKSVQSFSQEYTMRFGRIVKFSMRNRLHQIFPFKKQ